MKLTGFRDKAKSKIPGFPDILTEKEINDSLVSSLESRFSEDYPQVIVLDITGDGSQRYSVPADWVEGFSFINELEFPVGDIPKTIIDKRRYSVDKLPSGQKITLINITPTAAGDFRITYNIPWSIATLESIPRHNNENFVLVAASNLARLLSAAFSSHTDSRFEADTADHAAQAENFKTIADDLLELYDNSIGADEGVKAAGNFKTIEVGLSTGDRLVNTRINRTLS